MIVVLVAYLMTDVMALKASLRLEIKNRLKEVCQADILQQAQAIAPHIHSLPEFQRANGVSVFLSMKGEVDTYGIIKGLLEDHNKQVFIPKIVGKAAKDMVMVPLRSYAEIDQYPRNKWGIPEPAAPGDGHSSEAHFQGIDLVLMPGVGFDRTGGRLGHGKGYYGKWSCICSLSC